MADYSERLGEYMQDNLHPETARNIGRLLFHSPLGTAEYTMAVILEMQQDHARRDAELADQVPGQGELPIIERTDIAQLRSL